MFGLDGLRVHPFVFVLAQLECLVASGLLLILFQTGGSLWLAWLIWLFLALGDSQLFFQSLDGIILALEGVNLFLYLLLEALLFLFSLANSVVFSLQRLKLQ